MKIAVYTIAKNEGNFVQRWADSCKEADFRLILDTGSTDNTVDEARAAGVTCSTFQFNPWRFDAARELSLALLPADIDWCIALDMDEVLLPNWRAAFEDPAIESTKANRIRYNYVWSWQDEARTLPDKTYYGDKIHRRHTHYWKHPVHEVLTCKSEERQHFYQPRLIEHYPDNTKSRGSYLPLLQLAVREDPDDDRNAHYYGRELMYYERWAEAIKELERHLSLPRARWDAERAFSARYIAKCHAALGNEAGYLHNLHRALVEDPRCREVWCELAKYHYDRNEWVPLVNAARRAVGIEEGVDLPYNREAWAWGNFAWDLLSIGAYQVGDLTLARWAVDQALALSPGDPRIEANRQMIYEAK